MKLANSALAEAVAVAACLLLGAAAVPWAPAQLAAVAAVSVVAGLPVVLFARRLLRRRLSRYEPLAGMPADAVAWFQARAGRRAVVWRTLPCPGGCGPGCRTAAAAPFRRQVFLLAGHRLPEDPDQARFVIGHEGHHLRPANRALLMVSRLLPLLGAAAVGHWAPPPWWPWLLLALWTAAVALRWAAELLCDRGAAAQGHAAGGLAYFRDDLPPRRRGRDRPPLADRPVLLWAARGAAVLLLPPVALLAAAGWAANHNTHPPARLRRHLVARAPGPACH